MKYLIGVDEAGRGALAGPVCVGAVLYPEDFDWQGGFALVTRPIRTGPGRGGRDDIKLRDSKQLSAQQREVLYEYIMQSGRLKHSFALVDAKAIDSIGIVNAAHEAAAIALSRLGIAPSRAEVLLDAGLRAPVIWSQRSIVRGDETVPAIAFASIIAKVTRDRLMEEVAAHYSDYRFDEHKGYGTREHMKLIAQRGLTDLHRTTFCGRLSRTARTA